MSTPLGRLQEAQRLFPAEDWSMVEVDPHDLALLLDVVDAAKLVDCTLQGEDEDGFCMLPPDAWQGLRAALARLTAPEPAQEES